MVDEDGIHNQLRETLLVSLCADCCGFACSYVGLNLHDKGFQPPFSITVWHEFPVMIAILFSVRCDSLWVEIRHLAKTCQCPL